MEITAIAGSIGFQTRGTLQSAERINPRISGTRETYGDNRLHVDPPGGRTETLNNVNANENIFGDQQELFSALNSRIAESNNPTIEISLNINIIKANLGSLLATALDQPATDPLINSSVGTGTFNDGNQIDSNVRERYINALITVGIDDSVLFDGTNGLSTPTDGLDLINSLPSTQGDGRQLLLNLLIGELGTPQDEATAIVNTLQSQPFQTVA